MKNDSILWVVDERVTMDRLVEYKQKEIRDNRVIVNLGSMIIGVLLSMLLWNQ